MIICPWKDIMRYAPVVKGLEEAVAAVNALTEFEDKKVYPLSDGNRFFISATTTKAPALAEAHREFLDIQYVVKGKEVVGWADLADCKIEGEFNETKDVANIPASLSILPFPREFAMWYSRKMPICPAAIWMFPMTLSKWW